MTDEQIALARRAVACRGWKWMGGMATDEGHRVVLVDDGVLWMVYDGEGKCKPGCVEDFVPDLADAATLGCLLALVREAHGQSTLSPVSRGLRCWCLADYGTTALEGETEIELLVAALESAP
jgi:hypothetical protein